VQCSNGQRCCNVAGGGHCRSCCDNGDCTRGGANTLCCPADGACHQCCEDSDCGLAQPIAGGGGACIIPICVAGMCGSKSLCQSGEVCCNGACVPSGAPCVDPAF
jgi:hypothetical protein